MDFRILSSFFIRGDVRGAMEYMRQFDEMQEFMDAYRNLFEREQYQTYAVPEELNQILLEYQRYFRNVFYLRTPEPEAAASLLAALEVRLHIPQGSGESIAAALNTLFEKNGFHIQTGITNGHYGPYVWRETVPTSYDVELPSGIRRYQVNILRGFVMRSWMDYVTFGQYGSGGWTGTDGVINCIEQAYDFESERFRVSLLKHEAQHVEDLERWPNITPPELEYRAKLVELIYSNDPGLLQKFRSEADASRSDDSHAVASARIQEEFGTMTDIAEIHKRAWKLFTAHNAELAAGNMPSYILLDARQQREGYIALFRRYCEELLQSDSSLGQCDFAKLAEENLQSSCDHPYLIHVGDETAGLVVFMDEKDVQDDASCHTYIGEIYILEQFRGRGIAGRIAEDYLLRQKYDVGLCYVRGSTAERFWLNTMARLGYEYEIFTEDEIRDFIHIRLHRRNGESLAMEGI